MEATMSTTDQVFACLRYLAGQCDGAASKDGHGFNKLDVQFGHDLAMRKYLTRNQMVAATRMLKKYSKQLEAAGLVVPTVADAAKEPETTGEDSMEENMIVLTGQTATINDVEPIENETAQPEIVLSAEQQAVLKTMEETRQHLYITGKAGGRRDILRRTKRQTRCLKELMQLSLMRYRWFALTYSMRLTNVCASRVTIAYRSEGSNLS